MTLKINGEFQHVAGDSLSLAELLILNKVEMPDMVSVQINGEFVERKAFSATSIRANDEIEFLYYLGGG